jgi:hypothetical protein
LKVTDIMVEKEERQREGDLPPEGRAWKRTGTVVPNPEAHGARHILVEEEPAPLRYRFRLPPRIKIVAVFGLVIFLLMLFEQTVNKSGWADSKRDYSTKAKHKDR